MTEPRLIAAIDCGSTNLKAALFDPALRRVAEMSQPVVYLVQNAQSTEFDAELWWAGAVGLLRDLCRQAGIDSRVISHLAITSQAQTFTFLDKDDRALLPFISWLDRRATTEADYLSQQLDMPAFHRHCSFGTCSCQLTLPKLLWAQKRLGSDAAKIARLVSLPGYLTYRLAGVNMLDTNLGAMDGLVSLAHNDWWHDALRLTGTPESILPMLVAVGQPLPLQRQCPELPLADDVQIIAAGNDQTAGAYGNHCRKGGMLVTLGTALVVYRYAGDTPGPYNPSGCWGPYPRGGYYELAASDFGCAALDWARQTLMPGSSIEAFFSLASKANTSLTARQRSNPVRFYPERMNQTDAWLGEGTLEQKNLAVLEGIGFTLKQLIADDMGHGTAIECLGVIGGGSRSTLWLEILAGITGQRVQAQSGDSLLGCALLAMPNAAAIPAAPTATGQPVITPQDRDIRRYRTLYQQWRER